MTKVKIYENPECTKGFFNNLSSEEKSHNTITNYSCDLSNFFKFIIQCKNLNINITELKIQSIKEITKNDIEAFMLNKKEKDLSASTRSRVLNSIKKFFDYLLDEEIIIKNPANKIKKPKLDKKLPVFLTTEQAKKLLETIKTENKRAMTRDYTIVYLFLNCGFRISELIDIDLKDIDFENKKIIVCGKGNKERNIYLNETSIKCLNEYVEFRNKQKHILDDKALFINEEGNRIGKTGIQDMVKKYFEKSGLDIDGFSVHKLRHTAATLMYNGGSDIVQIQEILGHTNMNTTRIYTHTNEQKLRNAVDNNPLNL